jgi:glycine cleavage system H protein
MANWNTPADLKYTRNDEWIRVENDTATVGITDYAQDQLNDIVYVELPDVGAEFKAGDSFGVVESVKAASDLYLPVSGNIIAINSKVQGEPELLNTDPYGEGWLVKLQVTDAGAAANLMDANAYAQYCESR